MYNNKYFDRTSNRFLDLELDGYPLEEWVRSFGSAKFAKHPKGFYVFLPPDKLLANDEYAEADPYNTEQNLNSQFQRRRMDLTFLLAREAIANMDSINKIEVLDLGCGQGHITEYLGKELGSANFSGLDYSISAIEYARDNYPDIDFAVGDASQTPYANDYFDLVICNNLLEHVSDPLLLLNQIKLICKPGGYVIITTPSRFRFENLLRIIRGKPVKLMSSSHVTEYSVGQVIELLNHGGFQLIRHLSRPIAKGNLFVKSLRELFRFYLSLIGSHHELESTVFYLAKMNSHG